MTQFFTLIFNGISLIIDRMEDAVVEFYGFNVSIWSILIVFVLIGMFANVWWRGSKG